MGLVVKCVCWGGGGGGGVWLVVECACGGGGESVSIVGLGYQPFHCDDVPMKVCVCVCERERAPLAFPP